MSSLKKNITIVICSFMMFLVYPHCKEYLYSLDTGQNEYVEYYNSVTSKGYLTEEEADELSSRSEEYEKQSNAMLETNVAYALLLGLFYFVIFSSMIITLLRSKSFYSAVLVLLLYAMTFM